MSEARKFKFTIYYYASYETALDPIVRMFNTEKISSADGVNSDGTGVAVILCHSEDSDFLEQHLESEALVESYKILKSIF